MLRESKILSGKPWNQATKAELKRLTMIKNLVTIKEKEKVSRRRVLILQPEDQNSQNLNTLVIRENSQN